jgi:putative DNA primase/helicase
MTQDDPPDPPPPRAGDGNDDHFGKENLPSDGTAQSVPRPIWPVRKETEPKATVTTDLGQRLVEASFPHQPRSGSRQLPATITNVEHLLDGYGIRVAYDVIAKNLVIWVPGQEGSPDNAANTAMATIVSLAELNGLALGNLPHIVAVIGDRNQTNPAAEWIMSRPWDGIDRLPDICATLVEREDYPRELKDILIRKWLLSLVAAALSPDGYRGRGVLTLQGGQGIGKSSWGNSLVSDLMLRERLVKLDHHLDAHDKDSVLGAITHWIVELGELESAFRRDFHRARGFLTRDRDKVRRPYARTESEYPRRTVFMASVNDRSFLVDDTGNTRWWVIPVVSVDYNHGIDMQQVFAQLAVAFERGDQWWLTREEERWLEDQNRDHRSVSAIRERVMAVIDPNRKGNLSNRDMSTTELLQDIGIKDPSNGQCKECAAVLKELLGDPRKIRGVYKWAIPRASDPDGAGRSPPHPGGSFDYHDDDAF